MITMDPVINDDRASCGLHENKVITSFMSSKCNNVYDLSPINQPCDLLYPKSPALAYGEKSNCVAEKRKMPKYSTRSLYSSPALDYGSASDVANKMRSLDSLTTSITTSQIVTPQTSPLPGILKEEDNIPPLLSSKCLLPANNDDYNNLPPKLTLPWCNSVDTLSTSSSITCNNKDSEQSDGIINNLNLSVSSRCSGDKLQTLDHENGLCDINPKQVTSPIQAKTLMAMKCFECSFSTFDRQEISKHYATAHSKDLRPPLNNVVVSCSYLGSRRGSAPVYPVSLNSIISRSSARPSQTSLTTTLNTLPKTFSVPSHKWRNDGNYSDHLEPKRDDNNELQCFECTFTTISKSSMISHYNTAHESLWSTYNCFLCDTSADSKPEIATHIYEQHFSRPKFDMSGVENSRNLLNDLTTDRNDNKNNLLSTLFNRHSNTLTSNKDYPSRLLHFSPGSSLKPQIGDKGDLGEWFYKNLHHFAILHDKLQRIFRSTDFKEHHYSGSSDINDVASLLTKIMSNPFFHDLEQGPSLYDVKTTNLRNVGLSFKTKLNESWRASTYVLFRKYFIRKIFKRNIARPFRRRSTIIKSGHRLDAKDKFSEMGNKLFGIHMRTLTKNEDWLSNNAKFAEVHFYCPLFHLYNTTPNRRINGSREQNVFKKFLGSQNHFINTNSAFSSPPPSSATEVSNEVFEEPPEEQKNEQSASLSNFTPLSRDTHGNPKLYPCPLRNKIGCPFKTRNKKRWADHLDHHNGLKNHSCRLCPYKTTWYENLKQHTKRMHGSASTMGQISLVSKRILAKKVAEGSLDLNKSKLLGDNKESKRQVIYDEREENRNIKSCGNKMNKRKSAPLKFVGREKKVARLERSNLETRDKTLSLFRNNSINKSIYPQMVNRFRHATFPPVNTKRHTVYKHKITHGNNQTNFRDDIKKEQDSLATLLRGSNANKRILDKSPSPPVVINPLLEHEASTNASKQNENLKRAYNYLVEMNDSFKRTSYFKDDMVSGKFREATKKGKFLGASKHDRIQMDQKISEDQHFDKLNAATVCYREYLKRLASSNIFPPVDETVPKDSQTNNPWNIFPYYLPPFNLNHQVIANQDIGSEHMWMANHYHLPFMVPTTLTANDTPSYPLLCTLCSIYFKTFPELMTHYQNIHGIMPPRPDYNNNDAIEQTNEKEGKYSPDHCNSEVSNIMNRTTQEPLFAHQDKLHKNWLPTAPLPGLLPPTYPFNMAAAAAAFYNNPDNVHAYTRMMYGKELELTNMQKHSRKSSTESQEDGGPKHQTHKERLRSVASSAGSGVYVKNNYIKDHLRYMARKGSLTSDNTSESSSKLHGPEDTIRSEETYQKDKSPSKSITPSTFQIEYKNNSGANRDFYPRQHRTDNFHYLNDRDKMEHTTSRDEKHAKAPVDESNKVSKNGHNPSTHHRTGGNGLYCSAAASYLPTPESLLLVMSHAGSKQNGTGNANNNSPHLDFAEPRLASEHVSNLEGTILPGGLGPYDPLDPAHQQYLLSLGAAAGPNAKRQRTHRCTLPGCNFEAYDKNRMLDHLAAHRGEKPHGCPYCEFRTSWRFNIKNHIRSKHPNML